MLHYRRGAFAHSQCHCTAMPFQQRRLVIAAGDADLIACMYRAGPCYRSGCGSVADAYHAADPSRCWTRRLWSHRPVTVESMRTWEYAQLLVIYSGRAPDGDAQWTLRWYWPVATAERTTGSYEAIVSELNRAGATGWEIVSAVRTDSPQSGPDCGPVICYTFGRPRDVPHTRQSAIARAVAAGVAPAAVLSDRLQPGPPVAESEAGQASLDSALIRLRVHCLRDRGSVATGRLYVQLQVVHVSSDDPDLASFVQRERSAASSADRHGVMEAASDYAASQLTSAFGGRWWETPDSFALARTADLLDRSADWMRGLIEHPLAAAASGAGVGAPLGSTGAGITADFVTARLTEVPQGAAHVCEVAGIIVGAVSGLHPLAIACAKRLIDDELGGVIGHVVEQVADELQRGFNGAIDSVNAAYVRPVTPEPNLSVDHRGGARPFTGSAVVKPPGRSPGEQDPGSGAQSPAPGRWNAPGPRLGN